MATALVALSQTNTILAELISNQSSNRDSNLPTFIRSLIGHPPEPHATRIFETCALLKAGLRRLPIFSSDPFPVRGLSPVSTLTTGAYTAKPDPAKRREDLCNSSAHPST